MPSPPGRAGVCASSREDRGRAAIPGRHPMAVESHVPATREIAEANAAGRLRLPFADTDDFADARRASVGGLSAPVIRATDGRVGWDADAYRFLDAECPDTV